MPWIIGSAVLLVLGYSSKQAGEGIDNAGNGAIKIAVAGVAGFVVLKKMKVI